MDISLKYGFVGSGKGQSRCGVDDERVAAERNHAGNEIAELLLAIARRKGSAGFQHFFSLLEEKEEKMSIGLIKNSDVCDLFVPGTKPKAINPKNKDTNPRQNEEKHGGGVDVAIIVPLDEEYEALKLCLEALGTTIADEYRAPNYYFRFERNGISCAICVMGEMTNVEASNTAHAFYEAYQPKYYIAAGCAGSIKVSDVKLLDVVAATECEMPFAKGALNTADKEAGTMAIQFAGDPYKSSRILINAYRHLPNSTADKAIFDMMVEDCQKMLLAKANNDTAKLEKWRGEYTLRSEARKMLQAGVIASTDFVGKSELFGKWVQTHNRKYVAVEMEGGGVASALHSKDQNLRWLILRGITDAADEAKNGMEPEAREAFRYCGIYNVMRVLVALIDSQTFKSAIQTHNS